MVQLEMGVLTSLTWIGRLAFDFLPKPDKIVQRFRDLDHREEVAIHKQLPDGGIVLWTKSV